MTDLPEEDRRILCENYTPPTPMDFTGRVCARCGRQASKWMMATADESPTFLCERWPDCEVAS
jgi:hypothetical protein